MGEETRQRIIRAALLTLRERGFAGTTTRAIAATGDFNPGLIFYYFDNLHELLLGALEAASSERLERYAPEVRRRSTIAEMLSLFEEIYRDDRESGFVRVVSEMVAGSVANPELGPRVVAQMEPWLALSEEAAERALGGTPIAQLVSPAELASAAVTFYLGANLLTQLVPERGDVEDLLRRARELSSILDPAALPPPST